MKVSDLGEFGLIDRLAKMTYAAKDEAADAWQRLILGIGDDAAAWKSAALVQLVTSDSLIQDVHFNLKITSWQELGWRAVAANLSDIAAMGGKPSYALVSLALPGDSEVDDVVGLYRGMIELTQQFGVAIVGGDTSRAPLLIINLTILGSSLNQKEGMLTRSAASPGEKVALTGYLGASAAGLEMLAKRLKFDAETTSYLKEAFLKPCPRVIEGQILVKSGVRAAIDISDGLVADLGHLCQMSHVGARIEIARIPIQPAVKANFGSRASELALSGGEDFELLFTASAEIIDRVRTAISCPITVIGEITDEKEGGVILVDSEGNMVSPSSTGWEHFKTN